MGLDRGVVLGKVGSPVALGLLKQESIPLDAVFRTRKGANYPG